MEATYRVLGDYASVPGRRLPRPDALKRRLQRSEVTVPLSLQMAKSSVARWARMVTSTLNRAQMRMRKLIEGQLSRLQNMRATQLALRPLVALSSP